MRIAYDIDGCVVMSSPFFKRDVADYFGFNIFDMRYKDRDGNEKFLFKVPDGFTDFDLLKKVINMSIVNWHPVMPEILGALHTIKTIADIDGQNPIFITARAECTIDPFREWLKDHGFDINYGLVRVDKHADKQRVVGDYGITHYVEDRYRTVHELCDMGLRVYCMDAPYNRRPLPMNAQRVWSWQAVLTSYLEDFDALHIRERGIEN